MNIEAAELNFDAIEMAGASAPAEMAAEMAVGRAEVHDVAAMQQALQIVQEFNNGVLTRSILMSV